VTLLSPVRREWRTSCCGFKLGDMRDGSLRLGVSAQSCSISTSWRAQVSSTLGACSSITLSDSDSFASSSWAVCVPELNLCATALASADTTGRHLRSRLKKLLPFEQRSALVEARPHPVRLRRLCRPHDFCFEAMSLSGHVQVHAFHKRRIATTLFE
jgi:hypothetical protein